MTALLDLLAPDFILRNALVGGVIIGLVAPVLGLFVFLRRMVFLGVALPQISAAGIAGAVFWHAAFHRHGDPNLSDFVVALVGSIVFTTAAMGLIAALDRHRSGFTEGRIGVLYAFAGAMTILLLASDRIAEIGVVGLLKGQIVAISDTELEILAAGYGLVLLALWAFRKELILVSVDRELALSLGKRVWGWDLLLFGLIGTTISLGVLVVGPLVMFGFLVVPPLIASRLAVGLPGLAAVASLAGGGTSVLGFYAAYRLDWPTGPTDVALACALLALVVVVQAGSLRLRTVLGGRATRRNGVS
ncbi:MAG: metal ABC transporter permease [Nitrospirales bacterium]